MKQKIKILYDEEGDYLEINLRKTKDTYFDEIKKDFARILETKTNKIVGYAVFNFTKQKNKPIEIEIPTVISA